ncbi:MAG TPA: type II secretion system F family protein [Bryobacteraceae bacterium]|nr:type II secretion system F family protein [Bryobacteraceae bacterium]
MEHPILLSVCAFLMMLIGLTWCGYRLYYRPGRFLKQLGSPVITDERGRFVVADQTAPETPSGLVTLLQNLGSKIPTSETDTASIKNMLIMAGFRSEHSLSVFYGVRLIGAGVMLALCLMMSGSLPNNNPMMNVVMIVFGVAVGWVFPKMLLEKKVKRRQDTLRLALPDALDLLVVSVEAGLGLDMAMQHVARELQVTHPQLSEELMLVTLEMRAGKRRADALKNLSERTGEAELRKLVAILVQSDRFGTSMGESLRTHSDFMRNRRRQEAEERAAKVGVKLVFPIFFFILPSMLIVAAGPGLLQIFTNLFPMMRQIH